VAGWPGSNVAFAGEGVVQVAYDPNAKFKDLIDKYIALFVDEHEPVNFGALYFNEPGESP
jgi:hypothetical protein